MKKKVGKKNKFYISKRDYIIGSLIALLMIIVFSKISSGKSLIVTFVPGVIFVWFGLTYLYFKKIDNIDLPNFAPLFFLTLAVQFIHFFEEFSTGFQIKFPALYGGMAFSNETFVKINMVAYAIFVISAVITFFYNKRFLLVPIMFFVVYGAMGNAIAHTLWVIMLGEYFPGFFTAQIYWILGPLLLKKISGSWKTTLIFIGAFSFTLIVLLTKFINL